MKIQLIWLFTGLVLMLMEALVPGGVVVFLGIAAIVIFGLYEWGVVETLPEAFLAWFLISIFLLLVLRQFFMKFFEGEHRVQNTDEDIDALGAQAIVIEDILQDKLGRIHFHGSSWQARSSEEIEKDEKVKISGRDGQVWIVEKL